MRTTLALLTAVLFSVQVHAARRLVDCELRLATSGEMLHHLMDLLAKNNDHEVRETIRGYVQALNSEKLQAIKAVTKKYSVQIDFGSPTLEDDGTLGLDLVIEGKIPTVVKGLMELQVLFDRPVQWVVETPVVTAEPPILMEPPIAAPIASIAVKTAEQVHADLKTGWYSEVQENLLLMDASAQFIQTIETRAAQLSLGLALEEVSSLGDILSALKNGLWELDKPYIIFLNGQPRYVLVKKDQRDQILNSTSFVGVTTPVVNESPTHLPADIPTFQMKNWIQQGYKLLVYPSPTALSLKRPYAFITYYGRISFAVVYGQYVKNNSAQTVLKNLAASSGATFSEKIAPQLETFARTYDHDNLLLENMTAMGHQAGVEKLDSLASSQFILPVVPREQRELANSQQDRLVIIPVEDRKSSPRMASVRKPRSDRGVPRKPKSVTTVVETTVIPETAPTPEVLTPYPGDTDLVDVVASAPQFHQWVKMAQMNEFEATLQAGLLWTLPIEDSEDDLRPQYESVVNIDSMRESLWVRFEYSKARNGRGVVDIKEVSKLSDREEKQFWKEVATYHQFHDQVIEVDGPGLTAMGVHHKKFFLSRVVLAKERAKHDLNSDDLKNILTSARSVVRDSGGLLKSEIQTPEGRRYRALFAQDDKDGPLRLVTLYHLGAAR